MLPLSSTGMPSPPSSRPVTNGYVPRSCGALGNFQCGEAEYISTCTSDALASVGLSKIQIGSIGKITSTVAMSPLLVFSLVKNSGCLLASAARPQAARHSR